MQLHLVLLGLIAMPVAAESAFLIGLGDLPGSSFYSEAYAVSADGSTVVGIGTSESGHEAFRWTAAGGMLGLGDISGGLFDSQALAVSVDGSIIVGSGASASGDEAFRWSAATGLVGLGRFNGDAASIAEAVSADGSVVVGSSIADYLNIHAFFWNTDIGLVGLGYPNESSVAAAVSEDGTVVVGYHGSGTYPPYFLPYSNDWNAFRWESGVGITELGNLPGTSGSFALDVSSDGSAVVGAMLADSCGLGTPLLRAFRWTAVTGIEYIGTCSYPGGAYATATSADGSVVVGTRTTVLSRAVTWLSGEMRLVEDVLSERGVNLAGWTLTRAWGVSDDGLTIVGTGTNAGGQYEAWLAYVPEPEASALSCAGLVSLAMLSRWKNARRS